MHTRSKKLLFDILQACREVEGFNACLSLADYASSTLRRARSREMERDGKTLATENFDA